jgi:hypothetical protein
MTGFNAAYKAVFEAVKAALVYVAAVPPEGEDPGSPAQGVASIKTVLLGEQFSVGALPKAVINPLPSPVSSETVDGLMTVKVRFSVVIIILEHTPKDWFTDIITVMADVVDAILADRSLGGVVNDCVPTVFAPGEIKFDNKQFFGGEVGFEAEMFYAS